MTTPGETNTTVVEGERVPLLPASDDVERAETGSEMPPLIPLSLSHSNPLSFLTNHPPLI